MAFRYFTDRIDASRVQKTAAGMVRVDATVAKAGVYAYTNPDGSVTREYLPADEIARADSLASLDDVTVTNRHPRNMVDPNTWSGVAIGHARNPRSDGKGQDTAAVATLVISKADAQDKIGTDLVEVSRGVRVRVDATPGVTPWGEKYDAVQRDVVYNHVAVGPRGWNRQGPEVALRLDATGDEQRADDYGTGGGSDNHDCCANCAARKAEKVRESSKESTMKIKTPTGELEFKTDAEAQVYFDSLSKPVAGPTAAELAAAQGTAAAEKARADAAQARLDAHEAERKQAARTALEAQAGPVLGVAKFDSAETPRTIRVKVLAKLAPSIKCDGQSEDYVTAAYDTVMATQPPIAGENRSDEMIRKMYGIRSDGRKDEEGTDRKDGADHDAQAAHSKRTADGYRQPLSLSKASAGAGN